MIGDQISDVMAEIRSVLDEMEEGSVEWELMSQAHSALGIAHSLVHTVNRRRLARLLNED